MIYQTDILDFKPDHKYALIYADPPYNTGKIQKVGGISYEDSFEDYQGFLQPRIQHLYDLLDSSGTMVLHLDWHEVHYVKVWCDRIFGRDNFLNHVIWAYDFGGRSKSKWPTKHDDLLIYVKDRDRYTFNYNKIDLIPKLAPGLPTSESNQNPKLKTPTDVWWQTIAHTSIKDRYPTQKPVKLMERIIRVHSNPKEQLLDAFAGSGVFGLTGLALKRNMDFVDQSPESIKLISNKIPPRSNLLCTNQRTP